MADLRVESIRKVFGGVTAVKDVTLTIPDGAFVILVGPSGCGKTTLLRLLAGLEEATSGRIIIGGRDVTRLHPRERDIAMVFQSYALYPHMSVRKNMSFALELRNLAPAEIDRRVGVASELLGIGELLDRQPKQLSGGQRQRVALGRAIVREPSAFLFDEPLSNLDAKLRTAMRSELIKLHKRLRTTIVYVTHDQIEAMTMGQIVVVMRDGVVQQVGAPLDIYNEPENLFVAEFIGSPAMNFLPAEFAGTGPGLRVPGGPIVLEIDGPLVRELEQRRLRSVTVGLRPEHLDMQLSSEGRPADILGTVEVVEPLGPETLIEVNCSGSSLTVRTKSQMMPRLGERVSLAIEPGRLYLFDPATGGRITAGA